MLDFVLGEKRNPLAADQLIAALTDDGLTGTLYIGYPVLASLDEQLFVDALLTCEQYGVVVFDLASSSLTDLAVRSRQDDLYQAIRQKLITNRSLRDGRNLVIEPLTATVSPSAPGIRMESGVLVCPPDQVLAALQEHARPISAEHLRQVNASIQRVSTIKPQRKRPQVARADSRGAIMKEIEQEIANLDAWQKSAAIESPDGPQRIRGLAGSGKTVVLALKAAYLHTRYPQWRIAVTFNTRSLYQQFTDLIRRFTFDQTNDEPDWTKLQLLHAWGSSSHRGVYSEIASSAGHPVRNYVVAKEAYGQAGAFEGVCEELRLHVIRTNAEPIFDAVLIDEAQDFARPFFELVYLMTKPPHRVVFAYDELQSVTGNEMLPPEALFGKDAAGVARVPHLTNEAGRARRDIVLPICYRNTPWALTVAHALGFGIYREEQLVQFFEQPSLWSEIGYEVVAGEIAPEKRVVLRRRTEATPPFFKRLLSAEDSVQCKIFSDRDKQAEWVAAEIKRNITEDELEKRDILIILADPISAKKEAVPVIRALERLGIDAHLAGVTSSVDELFDEDSIAISGIHRAKGNEAPMVYLLNSEYGVPAIELIRRRNILFTAITRSRAWVRLCGIGEAMEKIQTEVDAVRAHDYQLDFTLPSLEQLRRLRRIHREISPDEKAKIRTATAGMSELLEQVERGELPPDAIPDALLARLRHFQSKKTNGSA
jgi:superfamily I DNA and RNA helicase